MELIICLDSRICQSKVPCLFLANTLVVFNTSRWPMRLEHLHKFNGLISIWKKLCLKKIVHDNYVPLPSFGFTKHKTKLCPSCPSQQHPTCCRRVSSWTMESFLQYNSKFETYLDLEYVDVTVHFWYVSY